ncbi:MULTISPECIES: hypothetical protein [Salinicola]|uniref:Uncharacterized protein n=1 Tax=Salinicola socius TaxID=404433 RepID=A0A1Q8SN50_9GAMM|nr:MULTISPECIES: hypothetical protein [Salinicola]OLO02853.1 hypothetical protein BTW07_17635 [Salinicola socius]
MIWHLVAAAVAGLGAAGVALLLRALSGKRLPRWIIPVCAGLGLIAYQINYEYDWYGNKVQQLPDSAQVVSAEQSRMPWRPWTYLYPLTTAFSVVDRDKLVESQAGGERLVEFILYRFEMQYRDVLTHQAYLMNCSARESVPLIGDSRQPDLDRLRHLASDDPQLEAVCTKN